jgi:hypothetical protein
MLCMHTTTLDYILKNNFSLSRSSLIIVHESLSRLIKYKQDFMLLQNHNIVDRFIKNCHVFKLFAEDLIMLIRTTLNSSGFCKRIS